MRYKVGLRSERDGSVEWLGEFDGYRNAVFYAASKYQHGVSKGFVVDSEQKSFRELVADYERERAFANLVANFDN